MRWVELCRWVENVERVWMGKKVWMADWIDVFIGLRFSLWPGWVLAAPIYYYSIEVEMVERV